MLELKSLCAGYRGTEILHGIDLIIPPGQITVIAGPNGCGKTTLLKTIAGIIPASGGSIILDGRDLGLLEPRLAAQKIAYLPQNRQIPEITVGRLVLHGRFPYLSYPRHYRKEDLEIAGEAMEAMGITGLADRYLSALSGGQRQKVYIAMVLAQKTPVVLMDEPTTYLDISHQLQMMHQSRFLADAGKTVVLVLHDLTMALKCADHLVLMDQGRILAEGTPEAVWESGCLGSAFGVRLERMSSPHGWQYYYREGD